MVRKNAVSASQKQRGPSCGATRRKRPLCLVLRRAILLPRAAELLLPVCRLPSQAHAQWLTFVTQLSLFRCILALTVPSAVGLVTHVPFRLRPDGNPSLQHAATRRHRTQTMQFLPISGIFLSQSIVLCERIRKPSIHADLRTFIFKIAGSGNAY